MHYLIVSFSYKNSEVEVREKLAFDTVQKNETFLKSVFENKFIDEAMILSTCNRVEIFLYVRDVQKTTDYLLNYLSKVSTLNEETIKQKANIFKDAQAIHHLFCVCSSLDSLVVGETQIAGQIKNAFKFAYDHGFCKQNLSRAIHFGFRCAAAVRNSTEISKNPVSVASVATLKLKEILDLRGEKVIVIGLGEMSRLSIKHLIALGAHIVLLNRDLQKAQDFVQEFQNAPIQIASLGELTHVINSYKILFSATGAPHTIITPDMIQDVGFERFWFDLAIPRDIDKGDHPLISLFGVDDLQDIVARNLSLREEQAQKAYGIIGQFTQQFFVWLQSLNVEPIIKALREQAKEAIEQELTKAIKKGYLPKEYEHNIYKAAHNIFNRFLHAPTSHLKDMAEDPQIDVIVESLKVLFDIEQAYSLFDQYRCEYATTSFVKEHLPIKEH